MIKEFMKKLLYGKIEEIYISSKARSQVGEKDEKADEASKVYRISDVSLISFGDTMYGRNSKDKRFVK